MLAIFFFRRLGVHLVLEIFDHLLGLQIHLSLAGELEGVCKMVKKTPYPGLHCLSHVAFPSEGSCSAL